MSLISFDPLSPGGYDPATFGRACRCCGSELWVVTTQGMMCSGSCKPRRLLEGERVLGWFDAKQYRDVGITRPVLIDQNEARRRGYKPVNPDGR
jgi:hypothetical protein